VFSNFSRGVFKFRGKDYPTAEHAFQAMKFRDTDPEWAEEIRTQKPVKASQAFKMGRDTTHTMDPNWNKNRIKIMREVVKAKFTDPRRSLFNKRLVDSGDRKLVERADHDSFWGDGKDRKGHNNLGKLLMKLRSELKDV
jgi:ribA/ribD-fused uncharacterized protein